MHTALGISLWIVALYGIYEGFLLNGRAVSAMHETTAAIFICSGFLLLGIGALLMAVGDAVRALRALARAGLAARPAHVPAGNMTMESPMDDAPAIAKAAHAPAADGGWTCGACGKVNPARRWTCECGARNA